MDRSRETKSSGRCEDLVCHGAKIVNVHVTILDPMLWVPPYPNLPYVGISDGST